MSHPEPRVHEMVDGEIDVWVDPGGAVCLKIRNKFNDPVELSEHEAVALGQLLIRLAQEQRDS